jgi:hypothetical protein
MADDNPFDDAFSQFGDINPPGTMTPMGLSPNDPLYDWGSNMKPSDLAQYVHDPQGFMNNMANSGQAPPGHNYVQDPSGQLQAVDQNNQPIRTNAAGRIQGNISDYLSPATGQTAAQAVAAPQLPGAQPRSLAYMDPGGGAGQSPEAENLPESAKVTPPSPSSVGKAFVPAPIYPQTAPAMKPPLENPHPMPGYPEHVLPPMPRPGEAPGVAPAPTPAPAPAAQEEEEEGKPKTPAEKAKDKKAQVEPLSSEAVGDFAKSLQGVKMPTRPNWQPMGAPAVRSPVGVQPQIQALLGAIGQSRPTPQQVALMKLLGRA